MSRSIVLFLLFISISTITFTSCQNYGKEVDFGNLQIFYKDGVSKELAMKLGEYLIKNGLMDEDHSGISLQVLKNGALYQLKIVVKDNFENNPEYAEGFTKLASILSANVFEGAEVEVYACDKQFRIKKVFHMETQTGWKTYSNDNYSIQYPASWEVKTDREPPVAVTLVLPENYINVVSLSIFDVTRQPTTIAQFLQKTINEVNDESTFDNGHILRTTTSRKDGKEYGKVYYTFTNQKYHEQYHVEQMFYVSGNTLYLITSTIEEDGFSEETANTNDAILNSFTYY